MRTVKQLNYIFEVEIAKYYDSRILHTVNPLCMLWSQCILFKSFVKLSNGSFGICQMMASKYVIHYLQAIVIIKHIFTDFDCISWFYSTLKQNIEGINIHFKNLGLIILISNVYGLNTIIENYGETCKKTTIKIWSTLNCITVAVRTL